MIEIPEVGDFLRQLPGFDELDDAAIADCARHIEIAYFRNGDSILRIGDSNRSLHLVRSGAIELQNAAGELVTRLAEGDCFGYPSLMNDAPARHHSVAIEDSLVYLLDERAFSRSRRTNKQFDTWFIRALTDRIAAEAPGAGAGSTPARTAGALVTREPVTCSPDATIRDVARQMIEHRVSAMLIESGGVVSGIATDRDFRSRVVATGVADDRPITEIMSASPIMLDANAGADEAAMLMMQHDIHHLPVVNGERVVGMISRSDFMRLETEHPLYFVSDIGRQASAEGIVELCGRLPHLIAGQVDAGTGGEPFGKFLTMITDAITRQLLRIAEAEFGPPPCRFAWIALGSQGRLEQSAKSDQDNALILADDADVTADDYFAAVSKLVTDGLNACGYVYCPGDVMASNPKWRQPLAKWRQYFHDWITIPESAALMHANIFFDLRCVAGDASLVDVLKQSISEDAPRNEIFLALMARNATQYQPPLGFFRQFVLEKSGEHKNTLDLKLHGILPLVEIARIRALAVGALPVGTRSRLRAAASAGEITDVDAANLTDALDCIDRLRIAHQGRCLREGRPADNHLAPGALSPFARQNLKSAFAQIRVSQDALLNRFHLP